MSKIIVTLEDSDNSSKIVQTADKIEISVYRKIGRRFQMKKILNWILKKVGIKESMSSIQIGKLTDEEMKRFNLGPYSKK
jgi:hypothetical protein